MSGQEVRASGFYWVRDDDAEWYVAYWDGEASWWVNAVAYKDSDFSEIDKNRIMRDAERLAIYLEAKKTDKLNDQEPKCS